MTRVLLLSGSPSAASRTTALLRLVGQRLAVDGLTVDLLQVRDLPGEALLHADASHPAVLDAVARIAAADAVVVGTPIYKASYTGVLKALLDLLPQYALRDKQVLPLATGGSPAHVLALDYALRPVLVALGAAHVGPGWFLLDRAVTATADGAVLTDDASAALWPVVDAFARQLQAVRGDLLVA